MVRSFPEQPFQTSRRGWIKTLAGAALVPLATLPEPAAREKSGTEYWAAIREQFLLEPDLTVVNAANLCPCPRAVLEALEKYTRAVDANPAYQNRSRYTDLREVTRAKLAKYLKTDQSEIALVRNTSEGNNVVASGLDLGPGDEVVVWDQNHATNNVAWKVRARRHGFTVREVSTPPDPSGPEQLLESFRGALTDQTRVLAVTHVSNLTGIQLPVRELCALARERNVLTLVDGAQTFGALGLDLHELGCDFFTGSAHKWFMGPREVGVLYVREGLAESIWPLSVGIGWEKAHDQGARRFETLGQRDDAAVAAFGTAVSFHESIGAEKIEQRVRTLATTLYGRLEQLPKSTMITPANPASRAGVVVFSLDGVDPVQAVKWLYEEKRIGSAAMSGERPGIRFSPHVFNTEDDLTSVLDAVRQMAE